MDEEQSPAEAFIEKVKRILLLMENENGTILKLTGRGDRGMTYKFDVRGKALGEVLDDVLVMGYPPITGFNAILTSETATVGAYQKSSTGQVIGAGKPYREHLDFFLINARVKGGNSGGPVINNGGQVIGVVVRLPFDSQSDSNNPRYDLMGYGVCLPSKYIEQLINNPEVMQLRCEDGYYML